MTLWRLEWLRLVRTKRIVGLVGVYVFFGFLGPLSARYIEEILQNFGGDVQVTVPEPMAVDGITAYVGNAAQIGLLVSVGIAAGALAFDARPQMGVFLRTRVDRVAEILTPRIVVSAAAVVGSFMLGSVVALYESVVLMGSLPMGRWALGTLLGSLYLVFVIALTAAIASKAKSILATVMVTIGVLLAMPILGIAPDLGEWLPSHLVGSVDGLIRGGSIGDYASSLAVTLLATAGLVWLSIRWAGQREL